MNNTYLLQNSLVYNNSNSLITNDVNTNINYIEQKQHFQHIQISSSKETFIPLSILKNNSSLESIVLYLKEVLRLRFSDIAELLNRNQRTIWVTYTNAKKKKILFNLENTSQLNLPLSMFTSRNFSILETIVFYLRTTYTLTFNQISELLGKNYRTVWTVYKRALKKLNKNQHEQ
jgi:DNA-directed RNA polymerase specialized sigma24 family protein